MSCVARVHLVHCNEKEAAAAMEELRAAGHEVTYCAKTDTSTLRELRAAPPDAVVVDLSRVPSHGREFAVALRASKATRGVPLVFRDGDPVKVEAVRRQLPDAAYARGQDLARVLKRAIAHPPAAPVVPVQMMDRFAGRTAAQKLGIREGSAVAVVDAPRDYAQVLGTMPAGVSFEESESGKCAITLWFVHEVEAYRSGLPGMRAAAGRGKLWVLWRKGRVSNVNERLIRETALAFGLVDYKICSVDAAWSGLLFTVAKG
jgi:DNA-binding NarL/FixJ family response regulator